MKDFFISYNRADRSWAEWIAWQLEEAGYTTVLQAWDFGASAHFVLKMDRALREAQRTIAVLSEDYLRALYTHPEWAAAFAQDPRGEKGMLAPVRVRECRVEGLLAVVAYIDLVGLDQEGARKALLDGVKRARAKPAERPAFPAEARSAEGRPAFPGALPPVWNIPHLRNPNFTGREELLEAIEESLAGGERAALTQAITGLGGVGKTQLAVEYAYRHAGDYSVVWWVRGGEAEQLASDYAGLAVALALPERNAVDQGVAVEAVRQWLEGNAGWLLVFDNVPHPAAVREYLPRGASGHVVITSRDPNWRVVATPLSVAVLKRWESTDFLRKRMGQGGVEAARLAEELGDLPLALEQAAAYMEATGAAPAEYLKVFRGRRGELWAEERPPAEYPDTVATAWELAMRRVREESPAGAELLSLCAYLAPDSIPVAVLCANAERATSLLADTARDRLAMNRAMAALRRYSLVEVREGELSLHRLVQAVVRDQLARERRQEWAGAAVRLMCQAFPFRQNEVATWPLSARLLGHALATAGHAETLGVELGAASSLLNQAGLYLRRRAELSAAKWVLGRALKIDERTWGPTHPNIAIRANNLGSVLLELGDVRGARSCFERALAIDRAMYGADHPNIAIRVNNIGGVLESVGDLNGARGHYETALAIDEKAYGPDHPDVATDLSNLGSVLGALGDLDGARQHLARALAIDELAYGREHPQVATDLYNLGIVLRAVGELEPSRKCFARALHTREKFLGEDHPGTRIVRRQFESVREHGGGNGRKGGGPRPGGAG